METNRDAQELEESLHRAEVVRSELDRRIFHLKTLYDVSKDIYSSVEVETILKNFLLMSMGNFGVLTGFVLLADVTTNEIERLIQLGIHDNNSDSFREACQGLLQEKGVYQSISEIKAISHSESFLSPITLALPFVLDDHTLALLGLGPKLTGVEYSQDDKELLYTLLNNLAVAVKNARSFEEIQRLNRDLEAKNLALTASLRKIEILESVKANLSKFVPTTVTRLIEKSPEGNVPETEEIDLSVLFLDIEGYTGLCERLGHAQVHDIIEKHFSVFMDAIYANNGDVNETAGDGLMVLFLNEDKNSSALDAVRAALTIKEQSAKIMDQCKVLYRPLDINIGINSGSALVGAAKFESPTGARWTYTARGSVINIAARIGALARKGGIFMSPATAHRIMGHYSPVTKGKFKLKNVSEEVEVFAL